MAEIKVWCPFFGYIEPQIGGFCNIQGCERRVNGTVQEMVTRVENVDPFTQENINTKVVESCHPYNH